MEMQLCIAYLENKDYSFCVLVWEINFFNQDGKKSQITLFLY